MPDVSPSAATKPAALQKPFVIEIRQDRPKPGGSFIPAASLKLNEEFRTSGLLAFLALEDLKSLLYLLTFISPEGHCKVSLPILTSAMKASGHHVKSRMRRLADVRWHDQPLIIAVAHESGLFTYSLHPQLVAYEHLTVSEPHSTPPPNVGFHQSAARNRIVDYSRHRYALPRAEVEKIVAQQLGHDGEETDTHKKLRLRLENAGLTGEQAREVLISFDSDVIAQQLDWLPFRHAKNPAGYLLAAIEGGYSEPRGVREKRLELERKYVASLNDPPGEKWEREEVSSQSHDQDLQGVTEPELEANAEPQANAESEAEVESNSQTEQEDGGDKLAMETLPMVPVSSSDGISTLEAGGEAITLSPEAITLTSDE